MWRPFIFAFLTRTQLGFHWEAGCTRNGHFPFSNLKPFSAALAGRKGKLPAPSWALSLSPSPTGAAPPPEVLLVSHLRRGGASQNQLRRLVAEVSLPSAGPVTTTLSGRWLQDKEMQTDGALAALPKSGESPSSSLGRGHAALATRYIFRSHSTPCHRVCHGTYWNSNHASHLVLNSLFWGFSVCTWECFRDA